MKEEPEYKEEKITVIGVLVIFALGIFLSLSGCVSTQTLVVPTEQDKDCAAILTTIGITEWVTLHEKIDVECYHINREIHKSSTRTRGGPVSRSTEGIDRGAVSD